MHGFAPAGVDLQRYAAVRACIAEGDRPLADVLRDAELAARDWELADMLWQRALLEEAMEGGSTVADAFASAFAAAQDALKPLPPTDPETWAEIVSEQARGAGMPALWARGISAADYARMQRHWTAVLARGGESTEQYFARFYALSRAT